MTSSLVRLVSDPQLPEATTVPLLVRIRELIAATDAATVQAWIADLARLAPALSTSPTPIDHIIQFAQRCPARDQASTRMVAAGPSRRPQLVKVPSRDPIVLNTGAFHSVKATRTEDVKISFVALLSQSIPKHREATHWLSRAIREVAERDLGSVDQLPPDAGAAVAIDSKQRVVGVCCVCQLDSAFRLARTASANSSDSSNGGEDASLETLSSSASLQRWASELHEFDEEVSTPGGALCGVLLVWVAPHLRGFHVASDMVDVARKNLVYGCEISRDRCAFSQPTVEGKVFAAKFTGRLDFFHLHVKQTM